MRIGEKKNHTKTQYIRQKTAYKPLNIKRIYIILPLSVYAPKGLISHNTSIIPLYRQLTTL